MKKQIESAAKNVALIVLMSVAGAIAMCLQDHGLKTWQDLGHCANHGAILGVGMAFAWIYQKSPFSQNDKGEKTD